MKILVLTLLLLGASSAYAQSCASYTTQAACYANRGSCHYDATTSACVTGAPSTCAAFYRDTTGCVAFGSFGTCLVNEFNNQCFAKLPACSTLLEVACSQRSDCHYDASSCLAGPAVGQCGSYTVAASCKAAGCYWDAFLPDSVSSTNKCFYNLQEVNLHYACPFWSNYPDTSTTCGSHGCAHSLDMCFTIDSGSSDVDGGHTTGISFNFNVIHDPILPNSVTGPGRVVIPLSTFYNPADPAFIILGIGNPPGSGDVVSQSWCNSVLGSAPTTLPVPSTYDDQTGLMTSFINMVQTTSKITYAQTAAGAALQGIISVWNFQDSWITSAHIPDGLQNIVFENMKDQERIVNECGGIRSENAGVVSYTTPVWMQVTTRSGTAVAVQQWSTTADLFGTIQVSGTSATQLTTRNIDVIDAVNNCAPGQKQRTWTVEHRFSKQFDSDRLVGLFDVSDVVIRLPGGPLNNCFGTHVMGVSGPLACVNNVCLSTVQFATRCTPTSIDRNSLNLCMYQISSTRIIDMGSDIPYPSNLNYKQSYYTFPKSRRAVAVNGDYDVQPAGMDPTGVLPDIIENTLNMPTDADVEQTFTLLANAGFLPTPQSALADAIVLVENAPTGSTTTGTMDMRNKQFYFGKDMTVAVWLPTQSERETWTKSIQLAGMIITAYSSTGRQLPGFLIWDDIKSFVVFSPREHVCSTCFPIPAVNAELGVDAFSVPVPILQLLLPGNGYGVQFVHYTTLPGITYDPSQTYVVPSGRRLLQTSEVANSTVTVVGYVLSTNTTASLLRMDLGAADANGVGVLLGVTGGGLLLATAGFAVLAKSKALALAGY